MIDYKQQRYLPTSWINVIRQEFERPYLRNDLSLVDIGTRASEFWMFVDQIDRHLQIKSPSVYPFKTPGYRSGRSKFNYKLESGRLSSDVGELLAYFTLPDYILNSVVELKNYYQLYSNSDKEKPDKFRFIGNLREFLEYVEFKQPKITIFMEESFFKSKTVHKTLRKEFLNRFRDSEDYEIVVIPGLETHIYDTLISKSVNNETEFTAVVERNEEILKQTEFIITTELIKELHTKHTLKYFRDELLQEKSFKLLPYKGVLQGITSSKSFLGENAAT